MKKIIYTLLLSVFLFSFASCNKDEEEVDTQKPEIDITVEEAFPLNGSQLYFGEDFTIKMLLKDNQELGSYSIEIHSNFDHHSHSTEESKEHHHEEHEHHHEEGEDGDAFYFSQDFSIPSGQREYLLNQKISIPEKSSDGDEFAAGDYHFMITVTDKAGFSSFKAIEIEIKNKD